MFAAWPIQYSILGSMDQLWDGVVWKHVVAWAEIFSKQKC